MENTPVVHQPSASSKVERVTIKSILARPEYQSRFKEVLGKRANQFVASVISLGNTLPVDVEPASVVAAAMTAAVLDLPVDKNLGFAWIVPYKKSGVNYGQFQMGYKGYIQLGLRSGQYKRMNAKAVNEEAVGGFDSVGEPVIDWTKIDETKPTVGYVFAFEMVNGFTKVAYWTKVKVEEHAKRYSQSFRGGYDSPWKSNFDRMALKTVIKNELSAWGILSIELQSASKFDQAVRKDIDAEPEFVDGTEQIAAPDFGKLKEAGKSELMPEEKNDEPPMSGATPLAKKPDAKPEKPETKSETPKEYITRLMGESNVPFDDFRDYLNTTGVSKDYTNVQDTWASFDEVPAELFDKITTGMQVKIIKTYGKKHV